MEKQLDEIKNKLNRIDEKLDVFCTQQVKNSTDIMWVKRAGIVLVSLVSFLGTQLYTEITNSKQPIIIKDEDDGQKVRRSKSSKRHGARR